jgi:ADP-ribosyl-[dinitrogen reductase] hydrolase
MTVSGSCLCGNVRYEIDRLDGQIGHCHCKTCRKAHSAAYASTARVNRPHFRWTAGKDLVRGFASSPGKTRYFCGTCGTHIVAEREGEDQVILRVASLDDDPGDRPVVHIWTAHDAPWLTGEGLPAFAERPPG